MLAHWRLAHLLRLCLGYPRAYSAGRITLMVAVPVRFSDFVRMHHDDVLVCFVRLAVSVDAYVTAKETESLPNQFDGTQRVVQFKLCPGLIASGFVLLDEVAPALNLLHVYGTGICPSAVLTKKSPKLALAISERRASIWSADSCAARSLASIAALILAFSSSR